jgi:hypothetical protein
MRPSLFLIVVAALAVSLLSASTATAATEFGDNCTGNKGSSETVTLFDVTAPGNPLPIAAPTSGVLTAWTVRVVAEATSSFPETLQVVRLNTGAKTSQVIGESPVSVTGGSNVTPARISIQAGDRLAIFGPKPIGTLYCETAETGIYGGYTGSIGLGSSTPYSESTGKVRVPVSAVIEPDADNDGYGDETQDKCPQSAAVQVACPSVTLSAIGAARKGLASITVTANLQATVTVAGTVKLGKGKSAKLSGGTQVVAPGTLAKFTLLFPKKLRDALKALSPKQSLTLSVTATAPNVVGSPTAKTLKLHLKGQAKPKKRGHKKPKAQA